MSGEGNRPSAEFVRGEVVCLGLMKLAVMVGQPENLQQGAGQSHV